MGEIKDPLIEDWCRGGEVTKAAWDELTFVPVEFILERLFRKLLQKFWEKKEGKKEDILESF